MALAAAALALLFDGWEVAAMAGGALLGWALYRKRDDGDSRGIQPPPRLHSAVGPFATGTLAVGGALLGKLFFLMLWTGSVLFGGGYMLVALLQPRVVDQHGWLTSAQFLDGIAITQAVPGPIVTLVTFVGFAVDGVTGAAVATAAIYIPSFAAVFAVAPLLGRLRRTDAVNAALKGVNAVVVGAIIGVALALARSAATDILTLLVLVAALTAILRFNISAIWLVVCGLLLGLLRHLLITVT
jgi:chromate transporter